MIEAIMGDNGTRFIVAAVAVAAGLILLVLVLAFLRNRPSSTFIRGGKNRQPRLAVLDAAAVDTRRRLVLVRRDDVEHLIMIGGPTDIVIESRIGAAPRAEPVVAAEDMPQPDIRPAGRPADIEPRSHAASPEVRKPEPRTEPPARQEQKPEPRTEPRIEPRTEARPVSAMAQVLYSDADTPTPQTQRRPVPATDARPAETGPGLTALPSAIPQQPETRPQQRPVTAQARQDVPRSEREPVIQGPGEAAPLQRGAVATALPTLDAEDILDAARARVLPRQNIPASQEVTPRPRNSPPVEEQLARAVPLPDTDASSDFERILDAEISGDLQRLAPQSAEPVKGPPERVEPQLTPTDAGPRKEPTIEQEMARMLGEMSVNRNN